ncbi:MAG: HAMP domain-containing histidine kinase, partial [Flavobacteriales bacterium]|nr:HAMP domain-containing histidine kinase [Flavobacteriales bacterium]
KLSEMKNDFIGNMTHELKTPISTIALSSEVLSDPGIIHEPERLEQYARIIRSENERLRTQVERVLQLSSLDKGNLELKREPVDMHRVCRDVIDQFALPMRERQVKVETELEAQGTVVNGDRVHLVNALANLVDNALKYGPDGTTIHLRTRNAGGAILLSVQDHGIGIDKDDLKHVFERFYRVHTGNVHDVKGFGLGLHYVRAIVQAHNGDVRAQSEPGEGSTFTISLPLAKGATTRSRS